MRPSHAMLPVLLISLMAGTASAQDKNGNVDAQARRIAKLRRAIDTMLKAQSLGFETEQRSAGIANPFVRLQARAVNAKAADASLRVKGSWVGDLLHHSCNKDKDELLTKGRFRIAREAGANGGDWLAVRDKLAGGSPQAFLLDPELFFRLLAHSSLHVSHTSVGTFEDKPVEIYTLSFTDKEATQLSMAGIAPGNDGGMSLGGNVGQVMVFRAAGVAGMGAPANQKALVDIALFVEPGKGVIQHAKVRLYQENALAGQLRVRMGNQADEDEEEEADEPKEEGTPQFKEGLPIRRTKNMSIVMFDITFRGINETKAPQLDATAKKLLGVRE